MCASELLCWLNLLLFYKLNYVILSVVSWCYATLSLVDLLLEIYQFSSIILPSLVYLRIYCLLIW
jgi:hypothetical protein